MKPRVILILCMLFQVSQSPGRAETGVAAAEASASAADQSDSAAKADPGHQGKADDASKAKSDAERNAGEAVFGSLDKPTVFRPIVVPAPPCC